MQIPVLSGNFSDEGPDVRTSYPVNMVPVPSANGLSAGYLRPADGIAEHGDAPGIDRGGINWKGACYRVMGTKLVRINALGVATTLGDVGGAGQVTLDYSFDRLAIASGGNLYYWDGGLAQVTDADLGTVLDMMWIDGYFMTTDGTSLVVTELNAPTSVNPLKYGSSEVDPDPVMGVLKLYDQAVALNRYTIEFFRNIGGNFFPFQRIDSALITKGAIGTHAKCLFAEVFAFVGSGRNEPPSIYLASAGQEVRIATREIDILLEGYSEAELAQTVLEARVDKGHKHLLVHLPDRTIVYDAAASTILGVPVWFVLTTTLDGFAQYRARNLVWCYDKWLCGDPVAARTGILDSTISTHYGASVRWEFGTLIIYSQGNGAIFHELELVCLTGRVAAGSNPTISTSYSLDGETWSQDKFIRAGAQGQRNKRLAWLQQGAMQHWRIQRFRGDSQAHISPIRLEANLEALAA